MIYIYIMYYIIFPLIIYYKLLHCKGEFCMKSMIKKTFRMLCLCLLISSLAFTPVFAAESTTISTETDTESSPKLVFISPEEMEQLIADYEAGIEPYNWFDDYVAVTVSNEGSYCKVVFMNVGFIFDRCDVDGTITLYDMSGRVVANTTVAEHKLVYGVARVLKIYPAGGKYATGSYSLRVSDGDAGTLYTGTF